MMPPLLQTISLAIIEISFPILSISYFSIKVYPLIIVSEIFLFTKFLIIMLFSVYFFIVSLVSHIDL